MQQGVIDVFLSVANEWWNDVCPTDLIKDLQE